MHLCMYVWMDGLMDGWMDWWMGGFRRHQSSLSSSVIFIFIVLLIIIIIHSSLETHLDKVIPVDDIITSALSEWQIVHNWWGGNQVGAMGNSGLESVIHLNSDNYKIPKAVLQDNRSSETFNFPSPKHLVVFEHHCPNLTISCLPQATWQRLALN